MFRNSALLFTLVLLLAGSSNATSHTAILTQAESEITDEEKTEIQSLARHFVARMMETRDLRILVDEFFDNDFTKDHTQDYFEKVSPQLYASLKSDERERLFVAQNNLCYFTTLLVWSTPEDQRYSQDRDFTQILPLSIALKLSNSRLVENVEEFYDREEFLKILTQLEEAIIEAREVFAKQNLEQTPEFKSTIARFEQDPYGLGYRVRGSILEEDVMDENGIVRYTAGFKFYRVETPIMYGLILIREDKVLKIVAVEPADGD